MASARTTSHLTLRVAAFCAAIAALCVALLLCGLDTPAAAWADEASQSSENYESMTLGQLKMQVDAKAAEKKQLQDQKTNLLRRLCANGVCRMVVENRAIAAEKAVGHDIIERYKLQRHGAPLIDALLLAANVNEFVEQTRYLEAAVAVNAGKMRDFRGLMSGLIQTNDQLQAERADVESQLERVTTELEEVTRARDEAQRKADMVANTNLIPDGANWGVSEQEFIDTWAPRLEIYLAGSPLAGQGATFAKAAWDNHIDPRWSAAISNKESSKGRYCIRPHNAWGWGAADSDPYNLAAEWATWEDAINAHARGLARGYGYTVSVAGAQRYCPPNWEDWYTTVVNDMNRI